MSPVKVKFIHALASLHVMQGTSCRARHAGHVMQGTSCSAGPLDVPRSNKYLVAINSFNLTGQSL